MADYSDETIEELRRKQAEARPPVAEPVKPAAKKAAKKADG